MKPNEKGRGQRLATSILEFHEGYAPLPGVIPENRLLVFTAQLVDSLRRIDFVHHIRDNVFDARRQDPSSSLFDPLRAASLHRRHGNLDEACWLVFLATHFGKHAADGWRLTRDVYGKLGAPEIWTWEQVSADPPALGEWLKESIDTMRGDGINRRFSNHRKYESLVAPKGAGTPEVVRSYANWVMESGSHRDLILNTHKAVGQHPGEAFDHLYHSMQQVKRFGRLAKFDFLTMLGKLGLAPIEPPYAYLSEATGPLKGAKLLFTGDQDSTASAAKMEECTGAIAEHLGVGMQAMEDALCNWQKSPGLYRYFRG